MSSGRRHTTTQSSSGSLWSRNTYPHGSSNGTRASSPRKIYQIFAGQVFDPVERLLIPRQIITVDGDTGIILDVSAQEEGKTVKDILLTLSRSLDELGARADVQTKLRMASDAEVVKVNMWNMTILPGLVDVHVHLFLHPYAETPWEDQLTKESLAERTIRATTHARNTLLAGFTTVRDLGTEGAFDADIGLRKCLSGRQSIIPGPRYYCANRAINSTGAYGPKSSLYPGQEGVDGVTGAAPVDGIDNCVREVRRQIGAGADWIKIYADYACRSRMSDVSSFSGTEAIATFNKDELKAMIDAAHARGVKVAVHANTAGAIDMLLDLKVDTIEHGNELYDEPSGNNILIRKFSKANGTTTWVPTLAALYTLFVDSKGKSDYARQRWETHITAFREAVKAGMDNIACGGDTGVFAHGKNALELVLMRKLGASWDRVLSWATYGGWKCVRGMEWEGSSGDQRMMDIDTAGFAGLINTGFKPEHLNGLERGVPFGVLRPGWAADIIGVVGNLDGTADDFEDALTTGITFVMKGGKIYKDNSQEVTDG